MYVSLKLTSFVYVVLIILNDLTSCVKGFFDVSFPRKPIWHKTLGLLLLLSIGFVYFFKLNSTSEGNYFVNYFF